MVRITQTHKLTGHTESLLEPDPIKAEAIAGMIRTFGNIESVIIEDAEHFGPIPLTASERTCYNIRAPL